MAVDAQKNTSWMGYPEPSDTDSIPRISAEEVAQLMGENGTDASSRIQLVDVRRSDLTGHALQGSLNLPAHTFYPSRASIAALFASAGTVILYCSSSMGRGPRCAGWLRDAFALSTSTAPATAQAQVKILEGGVKGFVARYKDDDALVYKLPDEVMAS